MAIDREEVSHRLRTPLTLVKGVLKMLASRKMDDVPQDIRDELLARADAQLHELEAAIRDVEAHFTSAWEEDAVVLYLEEERAAT